MNNEAKDVSAGRENSTLALYVTLITFQLSTLPLHACKLIERFFFVGCLVVFLPLTYDVLTIHHDVSRYHCADFMIDSNPIQFLTSCDTSPIRFQDLA